MARKTKTHYEIVMTVEGKNTFPLDMLRYDTCMPKTEADTNQIGRHRHDFRRVDLRRFCKPGMNERSGEPRWNSYGWRIVDITFPDQ